MGIGKRIIKIIVIILFLFNYLFILTKIINIYSFNKNSGYYNSTPLKIVSSQKLGGTSVTGKGKNTHAQQTSTSGTEACSTPLNKIHHIF